MIFGETALMVENDTNGVRRALEMGGFCFEERGIVVLTAMHVNSVWRNCDEGSQ